MFLSTFNCLKTKTRSNTSIQTFFFLAKNKCAKLSRSNGSGQYCGHDHKYASAHKPVPGRAATIYTITYKKPVIVRGVRIVQHTNGINCIQVSVDGIDVGNKCVLPLKHGGSQFRPEFKITDITGYKQKDEKGKGDAGTSAPTETRTPVAWMSGVNVDASKPGYLLKTGGGSGGQGANGGYSAGAVSTQEITYNEEPQGVSFKCDASLTATPNYPAAGMLLGLGYADSGQNYKDIEYAIYCDVLGTPPFQVFEGSGGSTVPVFTDHTTITSKDEFKVQVTGNVVQYLKNNMLLYESNRPVPQFPLRVDTSIRNDGCAFSDVAIF